MPSSAERGCEFSRADGTPCQQRVARAYTTVCEGLCNDTTANHLACVLHFSIVLTHLQRDTYICGVCRYPLRMVRQLDVAA